MTDVSIVHLGGTHREWAISLVYWRGMEIFIT